LQHVKIKNCPSSDALLQPVFPELDYLSYVASNDHDNPCRCISNLIKAVKQAAKYIVLYDSLCKLALFWRSPFQNALP
jgi:hypothetical protein